MGLRGPKCRHPWPLATATQSDGPLGQRINKTWRVAFPTFRTVGGIFNFQGANFQSGNFQVANYQGVMASRLGSAGSACRRIMPEYPKDSNDPNDP